MTVTMLAASDDHRAAAGASGDSGRPFALNLKQYYYDFYKLDPMVFAPAEVLVCNLATGKSFRGGAVDLGRLGESFGVVATKA